MAVIVSHREPPPIDGVIEGVYDLTAPITGFDPAWGDLTGYLYTGVLTFRRDARYAPGIGGTFSDFRVTGPEGESVLTGGNGSGSGIITSFFYGERLIIELVGDYFHFELSPENVPENVLGSVVLGSFFTGGHIGGTFTAERREGE